jgi:hypothetical protein
MIPQHH